MDVILAVRYNNKKTLIWEVPDAIAREAVEAHQNGTRWNAIVQDIIGRGSVLYTNSSYGDDAARARQLAKDPDYYLDIEVT